PEYIIWNYDHCLEAFKAVENNARKNPDVEFENYHGFNGLLYVQDPAVDEFDISKDVFKVARTFGIPYNKDFNGAKQNGVGRYQLMMKDGKRFTLADGYLKDALKKVMVYPSKPFIKGYPHVPGDDNVGKFVGVNVKSFTHVLNIIWKEDENVAIGVRYSYCGKDHNCYIAPKGEVIICGGAINSPQILMLSGIGPKKNLEDNNIKVRKELPVGHNLWDHPLCIITASVSVPGNIEGKIPSQEEFNDERPDIQQYSVAALFDHGILDEHPTDEKDFYSMSTTLNLPSSVGHLELRSSDPFDHPKIFLNYYDKPEDLYRMMSSLKLSRKILEQPPLSTYWGVKVIGLDEVNDDKEWEKYIRKRTTSAHPCGTVKMAPESKGGCVNHRLQVYGTKNLRVVDASIFPTIPAGNINAPTAMVAWRASKLIEEDYCKKV
ncbi:17357_t:CDS:2, partial [Acaulospora morrowiae]